jgi:hypothetical protein
MSNSQTIYLPGCAISYYHQTHHQMLTTPMEVLGAPGLAEISAIWQPGRRSRHTYQMRAQEAPAGAFTSCKPQTWQYAATPYYLFHIR